MHISFLDPYQPRPSLIHRLDARVKLVLALAFILADQLVNCQLGGGGLHVMVRHHLSRSSSLSRAGANRLLSSCCAGRFEGDGCCGSFAGRLSLASEICFGGGGAGEL